jgi:hypothetical protein
MLEWRRSVLYQHSIHSKIALASADRVSQVRESKTSSCKFPRTTSSYAQAQDQFGVNSWPAVGSAGLLVDAGDLFE